MADQKCIIIKQELSKGNEAIIHRIAAKNVILDSHKTETNDFVNQRIIENISLSINTDLSKLNNTYGSSIDNIKFQDYLKCEGLTGEIMKRKDIIYYGYNPIPKYFDSGIPAIKENSVVKYVSEYVPLSWDLYVPTEISVLLVFIFIIILAVILFVFMRRKNEDIESHFETEEKTDRIV
jgi:hypothetical protein